MARTAAADVLNVGYLSDDDKRALVHRLNRAIGQIAALRRGIEEGACVDELLIQLSAPKAALNQVALKLVEEHMLTCVRTCMKGDQEHVIRRITRALAAAFRTG